VVRSGRGKEEVLPSPNQCGGRGYLCLCKEKRTVGKIFMVGKKEGKPFPGPGERRRPPHLVVGGRKEKGG